MGLGRTRVSLPQTTQGCDAFAGGRSAVVVVVVWGRQAVKDTGVAPSEAPGYGQARWNVTLIFDDPDYNASAALAT